MGWLSDHWRREGPGIPKDLPRKTGLALLAETIRREWWELVKLNLLFVLASLPLVTLPAAQVAATRICLAMVEDRNHYLWRDFREAFTARFLEATAAGLALCGALLLAGYVTGLYAHMAVGNLAFVAPLALSAAVLLLLPLYGGHLFVLMAMTSLPVGRLVWPAFLGLLSRPLPALSALAAVAVLWIAHVVLYPASVLMPALFNFSIGTLLMTFSVHKAAVLALSSAEADERADRRTTGDALCTPNQGGD